jgi:hypothetical protein
MGKSTLSRLGARTRIFVFHCLSPQLETPVCQRRTCPRYNDEIHCTSSPARDWARSHEIHSREERPIRNVSTVASKSRTPPETAARVLIGAITEPGRAMPALEKRHSRLPTRPHLPRPELPVLTRCESPNRFCKRVRPYADKDVLDTTKGS